MKWLAKWVPLTMATLFTTAATAQYQDPSYLQDIPPQTQQPQQGAPQAFAQAELDQMLAPIALYPDSLLSQILMASTYPDQVEQAAAWSRANPRLSGEEAVRAVQNQPWDPSVISLVAFPQVLAQMSQQRDWTFRLGQAYMTMSAQMMDSIQGLRARADQNGNLQTNGQQVVEQQDGNYMIEPPNPEVMQVPYYDPREAYGAWPYPSYAPVYWDPWPAYWGAGIVLGSAFWFGAFDWHNHYIHYSHNHPWYYHGNSWHGGQRWAHNGSWNGGSHNAGWNNGSHGGTSNRWQADRGNWDRRAQAGGGQAWRGGDGQRWQANGGAQAQRVQTAGVNPAARPQYRTSGYQQQYRAPSGQQRAAQQAYRAQRGPAVREAGVPRAAASGRQATPQRTFTQRSSGSTGSSGRSAPRAQRSESKSSGGESHRSGGGHSRDR